MCYLNQQNKFYIYHLIMCLGTWHKYIICKNMFHIITEIEYFCRYFVGAQSGSYNNHKQIEFVRFRYSFIDT